MEKLTMEGLTYSVLIIIAFFFIGNYSELATGNYWQPLGGMCCGANYGFPFAYYSEGELAAPGFQPDPFQPIGLAADLAIAVIIGFGISYMKNRVKK